MKSFFQYSMFSKYDFTDVPHRHNHASEKLYEVGSLTWQAMARQLAKGGSEPGLLWEHVAYPLSLPPVANAHIYTIYINLQKYINLHTCIWLNSPLGRVILLADFSRVQPGRVLFLADFSRSRCGRVLSVGEFTCYPTRDRVVAAHCVICTMHYMQTRME